MSTIPAILLAVYLFSAKKLPAQNPDSFAKAFAAQSSIQSAPSMIANRFEKEINVMNTRELIEFLNRPRPHRELVLDRSGTSNWIEPTVQDFEAFDIARHAAMIRVAEKGAEARAAAPVLIRWINDDQENFIAYSTIFNISSFHEAMRIKDAAAVALGKIGTGERALSLVLDHSQDTNLKKNVARALSPMGISSIRLRRPGMRNSGSW